MVACCLAGDDGKSRIDFVPGWSFDGWAGAYQSGLAGCWYGVHIPSGLAMIPPCDKLAEVKRRVAAAIAAGYGKDDFDKYAQGEVPADRETLVAILKGRQARAS